MMRRLLLAIFPLLACLLTAEARVILPQMFQSGMVLQRGKPIPVWGTASANEHIILRWQKRQYTTQADSTGHWRIDLPKQKAGGPFTLTVNDVELQDVLVGDVWLCSGQSNIDVTIERVYPQYPDEIDHFDNRQVRLFRVQNETNTHGVQHDIRQTSINWLPLNKKNAWLFSAVGTFLGLHMWEKSGVPQGIIVNSWGGTPIEAWISADSLQRDYPVALLKTRLYQDDELVSAQQKANQQAQNRWNYLLDCSDPGILGGYTASDYDDSHWQAIDQQSWRWPGVGSFWLRQHIYIDKAHAGQPARLLLGTLFDQDYTFVNGREVGRTYYQYPPRRYDIPKGLLHEGDNVITVRFVNKYGAVHFIPHKPYMLCFGPDRESQNPMPKDVIPLSSRWLAHKGMDMPGCPSGDVGLQNMATTLYNAVVYPLAPFALSGVVWYQGESNSGNPEPYADLLRKLMGCWRTLWAEPTLPFCIVRLANYMDPSQQPAYNNWLRLREQQRIAAEGDPYAEACDIFDLGEANDIHPLRKKEVAARIAVCFEKLFQRIHVH